RRGRAPTRIPPGSRRAPMKEHAVSSLALALFLLAAAPAAAIVGGNPTTPDQHPHYVRLQIHKFADPAKSSECGGSAIDTGWILTAAHCITDGLERGEITIEVFLGEVFPARAPPLILNRLLDGYRYDGYI